MKFYTRQNDTAFSSGDSNDAADAAESLYRRKRRECINSAGDDYQSDKNDCCGNKEHCSPHCSGGNRPQWGVPPQCGMPPQWNAPPQWAFSQPWWGCQCPQYCCPPQWGMPQTQCCPPQPQCCCVPGPQGPRGPRGFRGPKGRPGDPSPGAVIPFASGNTPVTLTTVVGTLPAIGLLAAIGASDTQNGIVAGAGSVLEIPTGNMAFSVPRNAVITAINVFFTNTLPLTLCGSVLRITAQLYYSADTSNTFLPLAGTRVDLSPTLSGNVSANNIFTGSAQNLNVNVSRGTRLLLVFSLSVISGPSLNVTLTGNASAGINII